MFIACAAVAVMDITSLIDGHVMMKQTRAIADKNSMLCCADFAGTVSTYVNQTSTSK